MHRLRELALMLPVLLAAAALAWPAPCADPGTCWLAWDRTERVEWYEIDDGTRTCAIVRGYVSERRGLREPRPMLWPAPGRCAPMMGSAWLRVRACNAAGCGAWSESVEFQPIPWRCYDANGEVPCGS